MTFSAFAAQAHTTEDVTHIHEARSFFHTTSAAARLNFRDENQANMESMSAEERQAFMVEMNNGANLNRSDQSGMRAQMQSMSTEDRQAFRDSMGGGQGNMNGMGQGSGGGMGGGYGRGFGKR